MMQILIHSGIAFTQTLGYQSHTRILGIQTAIVAILMIIQEGETIIITLSLLHLGRCLLLEPIRISSYNVAEYEPENVMSKLIISEVRVQFNLQAELSTSIQCKLATTSEFKAVV